MYDDLDDFVWDSSELEGTSTNIPPSKETIKRLEERRLVEESDIAIVKKLFGNEDYECKITNTNTNTNTNVNVNVNRIKSENNKVIISNQYKNELKQKESAKLRQKQKEMNAKHIELYGEYENTYYDYEDKTTLK